MNPESIPLTYKLWLSIVRELARGKTLPRILMNISLRSIEVSGSILDLGSSSESASYNRFLNYREPYTVTHTDWYKEGPQIIRLNLEEKFALPDAQFDTVTCFNVLEHIYHVTSVLRESARILKPRGRFVGATPFLVNYHPDPHDYFRYTHEAISALCAESGFELRRCVVLGFGPFSAGTAVTSALLPRIIRLLLVPGAIIMDAILAKLRPRLAQQFPLAYLYVFQKK